MKQIYPHTHETPATSGALAMRTSLQGWLGTTPSSSEEMRAMRAAVWHRQGIAVIVPDDIADEHTRRMVQALANRLYGQREERA